MQPKERVEEVGDKTIEIHVTNNGLVNLTLKLNLPYVTLEERWRGL